MVMSFLKHCGVVIEISKLTKKLRINSFAPLMLVILLASLAEGLPTFLITVYLKRIGQAEQGGKEGWWS